MSLAKRLALCAILSAITVLILFLGGMASPVTIALTAAAGLLPAVAVLHCGLWWGLGVGVVSGLLSLLVLPNKGAAVLYLLFFSWYPVVKSLLERIEKPVLCWLCKLLVAAIAAAAAYFVYYRLFVSTAVFDWWIYALALVLALAAFAAYDIAFSLLISFYQRRIRPHVKW